MQSMQRQFGKLLNKAPGDNAKVSALLNDYEDVDKVLAQLVENARTWRDSWVNLAHTQLGIVTEFEGLYDPIEGTGRTNARPAAPTPELQLNRTFRLKECYTELKTELIEEVAAIDARIIKPTTDARDCIAPIRKTIKKRENRRLDYEKAQDKSVKLQRKPGKNAKDEAALLKAQDEVARCADEFQVADSHLRETLPPIVAATFTLVPPILAAIVLVQNRLLGLYYTTLHQYCQDHDFPSPPPPMDEVIAAWSDAFNPIKREFEAISCIAHGKAARLPMNMPDGPPSPDGGRRKPSVSSTTNNNGLARTTSGLIPSAGAPREPSPGPMPPRPQRIPSAASLHNASTTTPRPPPGNLGVPTEFTTASGYGRSPGGGTSPGSVRSRSDYFGNAGAAGTRPGTASTTASAASTAMNSIIANKKKPPPPPKRIGSTKPPDTFVVALYTFAGQGAGDLSFQEGDRIRVVKKTGTDQDWWLGELNGIQGSFPANYCKPA